MMNLNSLQGENPKGVTHLSVYKQALSLFKTSRALASFISNNKSIIEMHQSGALIDRYSARLIMDTMNLAPNIALASVADDFQIRKHHLRSIRKANKNLKSYCSYLDLHYKQAKDYIRLLKKDISEFNKAHRSWERGIDL